MGAPLSDWARVYGLQDPQAPDEAANKQWCDATFVPLSSITVPLLLCSIQQALLALGLSSISQILLETGTLSRENRPSKHFWRL